ncbi:pumilio-family RNA binding repeat-containing protein 2 [Elsinoe australis]|uniref:Pumilio-family RNA binding repeat-containing protein 2 n=1 Tax=Elsinoe australis TaxID=40998 RepID=A0A4U7AWB6_9PEZI|nr:pumilio-family RNA binding repeat-containing protein 2 [Elsinoe australis]
MPPTSRPDHKLDLGPLPQANLNQIRGSSSTGASPSENSSTGMRYPLGNSVAGAGVVNRTGAGSPSKDYSGSRLFPKRAREIQAQEGLSPQVWGPPPTGSGHSTPLRETIPESPSSDSFPEFDQSSPQAQTSPVQPQQRRGRAGTVPSRFPGPNSLGGLGASSANATQSSQGSPATTPLESGTSPMTANGILGSSLSPQQTSNLLSRFRAGSMPQRANLLGSQGAFGPQFFANGWQAPRSRANTLQSIRSSGAPSSPAQSSRDSFADNDVKTLDYLGLVDTPQPPGLASSGGQAPMQNPLVAQLAAQMNRNANRFRSYSVNAKEKYADDEEEGLEPYNDVYAAPLTPSAEVSAAQALALQEAVRQHNLEVQAFTKLASASRPRARTAGMVEAPSNRLLRNYLPTPSRLDNSFSAQDLDNAGLGSMDSLADSVRQMQLQSQGILDTDDGLLETPTRALWLGNIPPSTTVSSLNVIFSQFGSIESSRVLTHKSCGFVNFDSVESAIQAKAQLHNKEIFPGAGAVRIGYAKAPSVGGTPGPADAYPSPSPDPFRPEGTDSGMLAPAAATLRPNANINAETAAAALKTPKLRDLRSDLTSIVAELGATSEEQGRIATLIESAISYDLYHSEVPTVGEPSPNRMHDAPRLREIRKRIDNNTCSQVEIENIAMDMLPEIGELASDYLGNTVVQKLFEFCSEPIKEAMLGEIVPQLAGIGIHKNGTWAAQKIIDVAKTPAQMQMIADALRPYAVQLFLDQYGNYVMQCCLRFAAPMNDFIFDAMLQKLWEVAQGRFGARAMRACLESHFATKDQQRMMASAIALHSVQLATNANGALLLTWFLDTCTFPRRRTVLAPRLIAHLVHLCTHKVAYLTVLKIINQRSEPEARDAVLRALFLTPESSTLQDILSDQTCGATFVFKVLTTPFLEENIRPQVLDNVRNVLIRLKAQPQQGYKRLMDEVGISTRHSGTPGSRDASRTRSVSRGRMPNGHLPHMSNQSPYGMSPQQMEQMMGGSAQRTASVDSNAFDPYMGNNMINPSYTHTPPLPSVAPMNAQQMQYQQQLMAQQQAAARQQNAFYSSPQMSGFGSPSPGMDPFGRPGMTGSPLPQGGLGMGSPVAGQMGSGFAPPGFAPMGGMGMNNGMYNAQYQPNYMAIQQQQAMNGQRRGRVNRNGMQ